MIGLQTLKHKRFLNRRDKLKNGQRGRFGLIHFSLRYHKTFLVSQGNYLALFLISLSKCGLPALSHLKNGSSRLVIQ